MTEVKWSQHAAGEWRNKIIPPPAYFACPSDQTICQELIVVTRLVTAVTHCIIVSVDQLIRNTEEQEEESQETRLLLYYELSWVQSVSC